MKRLVCFRLVFVLFAFVLVLTACANATPAPAVVAVAPTATNVPPTDTPIPPTATNVPPTDTPVPPTATATSLPPTATPTRVPPTPTATRTATPKPTIPLPTSAPLALITVDWIGDMGYEGRAGDSRWCQMHMIYHNKSSNDLNWPDYQPVFVVVDANGNTLHRYQAGYYSKKYGWPNGFDGDPPTIPAKSDSFQWTWYSVTEHIGDYCRFVYVFVGGHLYVAEYNATGTLINANATLPK